MDDFEQCSRKKHRSISGIVPSTSKTAVEGEHLTIEELLPSLTIAADLFSGPSEPSLLALPNELLDYVFSFLDAEPPSQRNFTQLPSRDWTDSCQAPLKALSRASRRLRLILLQRLFRHARLDACHLAPLLEFVHLFDLASSIESIVVHVPALHDGVHPTWYVRLLNEIPVSRLTVGCEPHILEEVLGIQMNLADRWAFHIPYQYLEVRQPSSEATRQVFYHSLPGLLGTKGWQSIRIHEGSSLAAYTSYEYFLKQPPSFMLDIRSHLSDVPFDATPELMAKDFPRLSTPITLVQGMLQNLREFSFVAVFPCYNHFADISECIGRMWNLERLFIKLCPEPDSTVLEDAVKAAEGHIDLNDPWNE